MKYTIININDSTDPISYGLFDSEQEAEDKVESLVEHFRNKDLLDHSDEFHVTKINDFPV